MLPFGAQRSRDVQLLATGSEMVERVRQQPPHLVIIDEQFAGVSPLDLVKELLKINAMVYVALVSAMDEEVFHDATEGLGILARLPSPPGPGDADTLVEKLKKVPCQVSPEKPCLFPDPDSTMPSPYGAFASCRPAKQIKSP